MATDRKATMEGGLDQMTNLLSIAVQKLADSKKISFDQAWAEVTGSAAQTLPMIQYGQEAVDAPAPPAPGVTQAMLNDPDMLSAISSIMSGVDNGRTHAEVMSDLLEFTDLTAEQFVSTVRGLPKAPASVEADGNPFVEGDTKSGDDSSKSSESDNDDDGKGEGEDDDKDESSDSSGDEDGEMGDLKMAKEAIELLEKLIKSEKKEAPSEEEGAHVDGLMSALDLIKKFMFSEADDVHEEMHGEEGSGDEGDDAKKSPEHSGDAPMPAKIILTNVEPMSGGVMDQHAPTSNKISAKTSPGAQEFIGKKIKKITKEDAKKGDKMKPDQEVAIAMSMAREKGYDVPEKKSGFSLRDRVTREAVDGDTPLDRAWEAYQAAAKAAGRSADWETFVKAIGDSEITIAGLGGKAIPASFKLHDRVWRKADAAVGFETVGDEPGRVVDFGNDKIIVDWGHEDGIPTEESPSDLVLATDARDLASLFSEEAVAQPDTDESPNAMSGPMGIAPEMNMEEVLRETSLFDMLKKHAGSPRGDSEVRHIASGKTGKVVSRLSDGSIQVAIDGKEMLFRSYEVE